MTVLQSNKVKAYKHKLKHGEAYYHNQQIEAGVKEGELYDVPQRMEAHAAYIYYKAKFYDYWLDELDESIPEGARVKLLDFMLGRIKLKDMF